MAETVTLVHPDTGGQFACAAESVPGWQARGWQAADDTPETSTNNDDDTEETVTNG